MMLTQDKDIASTASYKVQCISLDGLVSERMDKNDKIAFIKIDIDGSEFALFRGGIETIRKHKPIIFIEFSPAMIKRANEDPKDYFTMLCDEFIVFWYNNQALQRVKSSDYAVIENEAKGGITDLLLAYTDCDFLSSIVDQHPQKKV
jgi:hypothetical protein